MKWTISIKSYCNFEVPFYIIIIAKCQVAKLLLFSALMQFLYCSFYYSCSYKPISYYKKCTLLRLDKSKSMWYHQTNYYIVFSSAQIIYQFLVFLILIEILSRPNIVIFILVLKIERSQKI